MKESYLHFLWEMHYLPSSILKLTNGSEAKVLHFGKYNKHESGPDFTEASLLLDHAVLHGNIEIHLKSSDWYLHKHHEDPAFNNVILHVVWEHDQEIYQNGRVLPTLELSSFTTQLNLKKGGEWTETTDRLLCKEHLITLSPATIETQKRLALQNKLNRKLRKENWNIRTDRIQVFYEMIAAAFGNKTNEVPFLMLAKELPLMMINQLSEFEKRALFALHAGIKVKTKPQNVSEPLDEWVWKYKGLRPAGHPQVRLHQFIEFVHHFSFEDFFKNPKNAPLILEDLKIKTKIPEKMIELVFINAILPFVYLISVEKDKEFEYVRFELMKIKAENNEITRLLIKSGLKIKNAYDSQAFLELYNHFCKNKKCLECKMGLEILKRCD